MLNSLYINENGGGIEKFKNRVVLVSIRTATITTRMCTLCRYAGGVELGGPE